jgi:M6 family metalloprotease-like protein
MLVQGGRSIVLQKISRILKISAVIAIMAWLMGTQAFAAILRYRPVSVTQPDGTVLNCYASGDEYYNWLHDEEGYTIIPDPNTGYYTYAVLKAGVPSPSIYQAGRINPASVGIKPFVLPTRDKLQQLSNQFPQPAPLNSPKIGTINNLVVFIRFSGETDFPSSISVYNTNFNSTATGASSMLNYFKEASYNKLTISSTFYPTQNQSYTVSFQDSHTRGYYQPYNATTNPDGYTGGDNGTVRRDREHALLAAAVDAIAAQVPTSLSLDNDGDGNIDNVCFIVRGSPTGWSSLLWPHMWSLYSRTVNINGKRVYSYNFQLETELDVSVLCHEMFHSIGAPDLYHYSYDGINPVYTWDIMEYNLDPPQHMSAYMKYKYGNWISSIPTITASGTYTLNPLTSATGNAFRINSPNSTTEYFVVEFRKKTGTFESSLGDQGIIIYRINTNENGNADGPPDEVYAYRPGGTTTANGSPSQANFNATVGRTKIDDTTNPSSFLTNGSPGGLSISNISAVGDTMSFTVYMGAPLLTVSKSGDGSGKVISIPAGIDCGSVCSVSFNSNTSVTLTALSDSGSRFAGWSGEGCSGVGTCTVSMTAGRNVTALYELRGLTKKVTTFAGSAGLSGSTDDIGSAARFNYPFGITEDTAGNLYVADSSNNTIRKVTAAGVVTTLAGLAGSSGSANGTGSNARFYNPTGITVDSAGNLYVAEFGNHTIRKITPSGVVSTLAGLAGSSGSTDGTGSNARFTQPEGITVASDGTIFVADTFNYTIRKITPSGVVTTLAGLAGASGSADGTGSTARFYAPRAIVIDSAGMLYVADSWNNTIRKVTQAGVVTTLAGQAGTLGSTDGKGSAALFNCPNALAVDSNGLIYVADSWNHTIRKITQDGTVSTLAGTAGVSGSTDGSPSQALFYAPSGITAKTGDLIYISDLYNHTIRKMVRKQSDIETPKMDIDGDNNSDLILQNPSGSVIFWLLNGCDIREGDLFFNGQTVWKIAATGDFNGDGWPDLIWQHPSGMASIWLMNGTSQSAGINFFPSATEWKIVGTADFNGDKKPDIIWQHPSGPVVIWLMNGTNVQAGINLVTSATEWKIVGAADFNGDKKPDIVWQHPSGPAAIWQMEGTTLYAGINLFTFTTEWKIAGIADFNLDGSPDFIWQHPSGPMTYWLMHGLSLYAGIPLYNGPLDWKVMVR